MPWPRRSLNRQHDPSILHRYCHSRRYSDIFTGSVTMIRTSLPLGLLLVLVVLAAAIGQTTATQTSEPKDPTATSNVSITREPQTTSTKPAVTLKTPAITPSVGPLPTRLGRTRGTPEAAEPFDGHANLAFACLFNHGTKRCLDIEQSRKTDFVADAQMWSCYNNMRAQYFRIVGPSDWSYFYIANLISTMCLDVAEGKPFNGQAVRWWTCNNTPAQQWRYNSNTGFISPVIRLDLCLDPVGGIREAHDGQGMQLWRCVAGEQGHRFSIEGWEIGTGCRRRS
ncbi:ricin B lectin domain-containing protein [Catenaria anguillulae PL171]|uniref:Ricin B lectin domain-containing protein n=1 Tax=Catenaria anguillulae PL171 TaxID=765915 RepID=A0A1Y2HYX3_9FUNG|nr:ricin B lectin domain-containing protein [Catenaria anguillulae PL171]